MTKIKDADAQIYSAQGAVEHLYPLLNIDGDDNDRIAFALLALAESNLAVARAIQERS